MRYFIAHPPMRHDQITERLHEETIRLGKMQGEIMAELQAQDIERWHRMPDSVRHEAYTDKASKSYKSSLIDVFEIIVM